MTLVGGYKLPGVSSTAVFPGTISDLNGFQLSGNTSSMGIAVCMFKWDATAKQWVPYTG